jgi:hypothetical protein
MDEQERNRLHAPFVGMQLPISLISALVVFLIFTISAPLLNQVMPYSLPGGSVFAKFHPASYLAALLLLLVVADRHSGRPGDRHLFFVLGSFLFIIAWLASRDKGALAAMVIDIHVVPAILVLALSRLTDIQLKRIVSLFIWVAAANAIIVIAEFASQATILPVAQSARFFRPGALLGHPIMAGTVLYCAMFLVSLGFTSAATRRPLLLLLLLGVAFCGVRGPLAIATVILLVYLVRSLSTNRSAVSFAWDLGLLLLLAAGALLAAGTGAFDRIMEIGLWDESASSRFEIFEVLRLLSPYQLWNGVDGYDLGEFLAIQTTGSQLIENAFVLVALHAGLPVAAALAAALLLLHVRAMLKSPVFAVVVFVVAFTTIGFGVKNPIAAAVAFAGYVAWRQSRELANRRAETGLPEGAGPVSGLQPAA